MDKRITHKDVKIGERVFRLKKMDARTGTWIAFLVLGKMASQGGFGVRAVASSMSNYSKEEFLSVQSDALRTVYKIENHEGQEFPVCIVTESGAWADKDLAEDVVTLFALTVQAVVFNVQPFFLKGGLSELVQLLTGMDLNPPATSD